MNTKKKAIKFIGCLILMVIWFIFGYKTSEYKYNDRIRYKEAFNNLTEEHNWMKEQNDFLFDLIYNYDAALFAKDSIEKIYYIHKIDSLYLTQE